MFSAVFPLTRAAEAVSLNDLPGSREPFTGKVRPPCNTNRLRSRLVWYSIIVTNIAAETTSHSKLTLDFKQSSSGERCKALVQCNVSYASTDFLCGASSGDFGANGTRLGKPLSYIDLQCGIDSASKLSSLEFFMSVLH